MAEPVVRRDRAYYKSPEYRRICRTRRAERDGRPFRPGLPGRAPGYAAAERPETLARRAWTEWLTQRAPAWWLKRYRAVRRALRLDQARACSKARYDADPAANQRKVRLYKDSNPERVGQWHKTRHDRITSSGVEPISNKVRDAIFARRRCPYCAADLDQDAELDHIIPLARGGRHEARNLIACCPSCNRRKAARPFSEWLTMLSDAQRDVADRMFVRRFGPLIEAERVAMEG